MSRFRTIWVAVIAIVIATHSFSARAGVGAPDVSPIFGNDLTIYRASITTSGNKPMISFYGKLVGTTIGDLRQITVDDLGDKYRDGVDLEGKKMLVHLVMTMSVGGFNISPTSPFFTSECEHLSTTEGAFRCTLDLTEFDPNSAGLSPNGVREQFENAAGGKAKFRFALITADGSSSWYMNLLTLLDASTDSDGDGVPNSFDNCPDTKNFDQIDDNGDGRGDDCTEHTTLPEDNENNPSNNSGDSWIPQELGFNSSGGCSLIPEK